MTVGPQVSHQVVAKASTGDSTLSKSRTVYRVARPAISSAANSAASRMTVKWGKNAKATGYEIQYYINNDRTMDYIGIKGSSTTRYTISGLTSKKTYVFKIRTYKTVNGKNYYSAWSKSKTIKVK